MFDMTQCKIGDKLVTQDGETVVLIDIQSSLYDEHPYKLEGAGGFVFSTLRDGSEYVTMDSGNDIVGFAEQQLTNKTLEPTTHIPTISVRREERFFITIDDKDIEITFEELYNLQQQITKLLGE